MQRALRRLDPPGQARALRPPDAERRDAPPPQQSPGNCTPTPASPWISACSGPPRPGRAQSPSSPRSAGSRPRHSGSADSTASQDALCTPGWSGPRRQAGFDKLRAHALDATQPAHRAQDPCRSAPVSLGSMPPPGAGPETCPRVSLMRRPEGSAPLPPGCSLPMDSCSCLDSSRREHRCAESC